jgi:VWFA-related protein
MNRREMLRRGAVALAVGAVGNPTLRAAQAVGTAAQKKDPGNQVFRASVDVVSLNITVVDGQGHYITDLGEADFSVFEDGAKQEITFFNRTSLPIALSILIDTSASMEQRLPIAQEAAIGFAHKLREQDLGQIVDFDSRVEIVQNFTKNVPALEKAIRGTSAGGSTSLHNALYISLKELAKVKARSQDDVRRQAIVVLSDGADTSSLVSVDDVLAAARRSGVGIYTVSLQPHRESLVLLGARTPQPDSDYTMKALARETGAQAFSPSPSQLKSVYRTIATEVASQYSIGYVPKDARAAAGFRRVVVQIVTKSGLRLRTRPGYTDDRRSW